MGYFWFSIPDYVLEWASETLGPDAAFVETGTFRGDTALAARQVFVKVDTVEWDPKLAAAATERLTPHDVSVHRGDSREVLPGLLTDPDRPLLVWLDAHYCGEVTAGADDPCPLLAELEVLGQARKSRNTIVAIDDARIFDGFDGYPRLDAVGEALTAAGWDWVVVDDVILATDAERLARLIDSRSRWRTQEVIQVSRVWPQVLAFSKWRKRASAARRRLPV